MSNVNYPIALGDIPVYRGDAGGRNKVTVLMTDDNDDPVDMTVFGDTWACQAKGSGVTITLDVDDSNAATGVIEARIKVEDSPALVNRMNFDIQVTGGSVSPLTVYSGTFVASGQVTT